jgi:bifunctional non-homologous end joining protein LigD
MKATDLTGRVDWDAPASRRYAPLRDWLNFGWVAERKYDGDRASLHIRKGWSSFAGTRGATFPWWQAVHYDKPLTIAGVELPGLAGTILDGEFIAGFDSDGRELNRDITSGWFGSGPANARGYEWAYGRPDRPKPGKPGPVFVVFDLLALAGTDMTRVPYEDRRAALEEVHEALAARYPGIILAEQLPASAKSIEHAKAAGWEGLILKDRAAPYEPTVRGSRSASWRKVKFFADLDVYLTGGWTPGEGGRTGTVGSVEVAIAGPGREPAILGFVAVKPRLLDAYTDPDTGGLRPELAGTVWEVRANGITPAGLLIHPRMMHVRHDKTPDDCGLEQLDALPAAA